MGEGRRPGPETESWELSLGPLDHREHGLKLLLRVGPVFVEVAAVVMVTVVSWLSGGQTSAGFGFSDCPLLLKAPLPMAPGTPLSRASCSLLLRCLFLLRSFTAAKPDVPGACLCPLCWALGSHPPAPVTTHVREASRSLLPRSPYIQPHLSYLPLNAPEAPQFVLSKQTSL